MHSRTAPVSGLQRGMWFLDRMHPGSAAYTVPWVFTFDRPVDAELLQRAVDRIVDRHEALRTTFTLGPDGPRQVVHDRLPVPLRRGGYPDLAAAIAGEAAFDLTTGPLLRAVLVDARTLLLTVHHIVWDGASAGVFERELAECYTAEHEGREPVLPALATQYADHATTPVDDADEQLDYWRAQLAGAPARLDVPADRHRPTAGNFAGRTREFDLPDGTGSRVRTLATTADATPFVVQLAAFAALLNRYTGAADLLIGAPVSTRNRPELTDLIGYFVNLVPLRVRVDRADSFRALVEQVRDTVFDAFGYPDVPFDAIVDAVRPERAAGVPPLVQVVFGAHVEDPAPLRFGPLAATRRVEHNGTSKFDLTWSTFDDGDLRGEVEFSTDLFDAATVDRMIGHWRTLLDAVLADPDRPLWSVSLDVPAAAPERDRAPAAHCLHHGFEAAADRFPDRPALTYGDTTISYATLEQRANRLAHALIAHGVRRGDRVGMLLDRTDLTVVTILAVLKAGAAYVPVDPAAPDDRAAFVFADTAVRLVVADREVPDGLVRLDPAVASDGALPAARPEVPVGPDDLAYLIFTSGSTGRPKAVAVAHRQVARLMASGLPHFDFAETDVWTLFHSCAFDWTVWEIWGALLHGGRLVVVPYLLSRSPEDFAGLLAAERVTMLCQTPSALRQLEAALRAAPRPLPALRWVMLGGEALDPAVVRRWHALSGGAPAPLCNLYGITETTVHVTTHDVTPDHFARSLIGAPMPHLSVTVRDAWLQPCPIGVPGEMYVEGAGLADGYWARPGLTAQRFLPAPGGGRMYRTGDLARRLADGGLEYLGRGDDQVKIRGFRIELGEIESVLAAHPAVDDAVVTVYRPDGDEPRLAGYVTARGPAPTYPQLREHLAAALPVHMIPATVTVLPALPVTVNGKLDRAALPAPTAERADAGTRYAAPATPAERLLTRAWSQVLGVTDVGAQDNFFHLGGDSIRAVQLAAALREQGWAVTLADLFTAPTPAALAPLLRPVDASAGRTRPFDGLTADEVAALPADVVDAYPMAAMQLGMIFHMELSGDAGGYHNVNSFRVAGRLDEAAMRTAVADVIARHPVLRTSLHVVGHRQPLQLVHARMPAPVEITDLRALSPADRDAAVTEVFDALCATRFDPRRPPLFRVCAQRLTDDEFQLTIAEHHAILDGWSFTSLLTELLDRHRDPHRPAAPPPESTFRDFVAAEQAAADSADSAAFWRERLAGASGALFSDRTDSTEATIELPRTVERLLPDAPAQLAAAAEAAGTPIKAVALAAHVTALHRITGRSRLTTGLSVNGRLEERGGTDAYGLFLNTVPLALDLDALGDGPELVRALHEIETALLPHRRVPFARLARYMAGARLETCFALLRFHQLGRAGIVDDARTGCEPTLRYEPTNFALGAALVQDPGSGRTLLAVDHLRSLVPDGVADAYADAFASALGDLATATTPTAGGSAHRPVESPGRN
ncbi:amino acid adenylation domain-containing protein [Krasilnikovia cinnamomea]|uniref:Amino acid adenylation domain-containing protein n=1 Tax=Krasilnikovia cinnamomea TaxID=349313 RepID=A0A4Q7ZSB4_9ACTN|nr:non-ribosomal peptide synthetase [Krasilnikovia cinnamomea]RZU53359.1 amino acid adenylation domain-containing protein [Krasilnikovia cinnamomea]